MTSGDGLKQFTNTSVLLRVMEGLAAASAAPGGNAGDVC
jgi:hypothetical protein